MVAERVEAADKQCSGGVDHRARRLGGVPAPPRVARQDIPGLDAGRRLEHQTGGADQAVRVARLDEIGARRSTLP